MKSLAIVLFTLFTSVLGTSSPKFRGLERDVQVLPEVGLELEELIQYYGYSVETHEVKTEDGYLLTVNHILPLNPNASEDKKVVMMVPGLLCSGAAFTVNGKNSSLAFLLAEAGYDVWLMNYRGTTYSRKHVSLDPDVDKAAFWDFSFHEMGHYDVPASIDFILGQTKQKSLYYIGHSQGTSSFFAFASTRPEYNEKIRLAVNLAPVAYMKNIKSPLVRFLSDNFDFLRELAKDLEFYELLPHWDIINELGKTFCNDESPVQFICIFVLSTIGGFDEKELNKTMIPLVTSTFPAGSSKKQLFHYRQEIVSGKFQQYDYGPPENLLHYGNLFAPIYDISKITAPVALVYSQNDWFAATEDVERLANELPNVVLKHLVEDEEFSHVDFMWAIDLNALVNNLVIDFMRNY